MNFTSIEILALIFAVAVIIKLVIVSLSPKGWKGFVKSLYGNPTLLAVFELILAGIVFYYLIQELSLVQIFACLVLGALLTGMTFAVYGKELMPVFQKMLNGNILKKAWLPILVWLALAIWVLKEIF